MIRRHAVWACGLTVALAVAPAAARDDRSGTRGPDFSVEMQPTQVPQGGVVKLRVRVLAGPGTAKVEARLGRAVAQGTAWEHGDMLVVLPVAVGQTPGPAEVSLHVVAKDGDAQDVTATVTVVPGDFETDVLKVGRSFTQPSRAQRRRAHEDSRTFSSLWRRPLTARKWRGPFQAPMETPVTARFGTFRTLNGRVKSRHLGTDLRGHTGDVISATNDGRVVVVRNCFFSGNTVVVDHGLGMFSMYFHMSRFEVEPGQLVQRGQSLGLVGKTGRVTGAHLHWGVKMNGTYVNPAAVLALDLAEDPTLEPPSPDRPVIARRPVKTGAEALQDLEDDADVTQEEQAEDDSEAGEEAPP